MPRVLTVSRVTVADGREAEYLEIIGRLAALATKRGQHLWVFRHPTRAGQFLEFSESASEMSHRTRASRVGQEMRLESALRSMVTYAPDSWELWAEVPLGTLATGGGAPPSPQPD
jgi:hypothetical protein